jgi:hypothetical protein
VLGVALACPAACREAPSQPAPSPAPSADTPGAVVLGAEARIHAPGELGHARSYTMSVEGSKDCPMERPFLPAPGSVKVGIEVVLEGTAAHEVPINPFYASLHTPDGAVRAATLAGCEPSLPSVRVTRGQKVRGYVTFELPVTTRAFELRYAPLVIGSGPEELRFALTR